jgi:hypothetical protein
MDMGVRGMAKLFAELVRGAPGPPLFCPAPDIAFYAGMY